MSDGLFITVISFIAAFWAYLVYRALRYGEFRRMGRSGWFSREDDRSMFIFTLAIDSLYLILMLVVIGWVLAGKPKP